MFVSSGPPSRVSGFHWVNVRCRVGWLHHGEHCQGVVRTHEAGPGKFISADNIYQQTGGRRREIFSKLRTRSYCCCCCSDLHLQPSLARGNSTKRVVCFPADIPGDGGGGGDGGWAEHQHSRLLMLTLAVAVVPGGASQDTTSQGITSSVTVCSSHWEQPPGENWTQSSYRPPVLPPGPLNQH